MQAKAKEQEGAFFSQAQQECAKTEVAMNIGSFVRKERLRLGLTQTQLAEKSGVGLNFVYQLEKNKKTVQLDTTNQVLAALGYQVGVSRRFVPWESAGARIK